MMLPRTCPELLCADTSKVDSSGPRHARRLGSVGVEAVSGDDGDSGVLPFGCGVSSGVGHDVRFGFYLE